MARKMNEDKVCPFCNNYVRYWPNYCARTSADYGNVEWLVTKRGTKQFFHRSCYMSNTIGAMKKNLSATQPPH